MRHMIRKVAGQLGLGFMKALEGCFSLDFHESRGKMKFNERECEWGSGYSTCSEPQTGRDCWNPWSQKLQFNKNNGNWTGECLGWTKIEELQKMIAAKTFIELRKWDEALVGETSGIKYIF